MGFLTSLFGGTDNTILTVLLALGIVIVLIVFGVWALKLLFNTTGNIGRGRNRRLSVIDSASIDQKRQLILVRRDDVEHLLVIGGPQDVVVETGITPPPEPVQAQRPKRRMAPVPNALSRARKPKIADEPAPAATPMPQAEPPVAPAASAVTEVAPPEPEKSPETEKPVRRTTSLRYTGLLRPANRVEPALHPQASSPKSENAEDNADDSAKKSGDTTTAKQTEPVIDVASRTGGEDDSAKAHEESKDKKAEASS